MFRSKSRVMPTGIILFTLLTLFTIWQSNEIIAKEISGANLNFVWVYRNPRRLVQSKVGWIHKLGSKIDFDFCLRRPNQAKFCDVASAANKGNKNEKLVTGSTRITILHPIPSEVIITIRITMNFLSIASTKVASFVSKPFPLIADGQIRELPISPGNSNFKPSDVSFSVRLEVTCTEFSYGKRCEAFCKPVPEVYECSREGKRICAPGLYGDLCQHRDACYFEPCAVNAICQNRPNGFGRICICNDHEGPECYPNHNPCMLQPCKNGGLCQPSGQYNESFTCLCTGLWEGFTCAERRSACAETANEMKKLQKLMDPAADPNAEPSVCQNGGKCFEDPHQFAFYCVCSDEWTGERCERPNTKSKAATFLLLIAGIPSISFLLLLCVALVAAFVWYRHRRKNRPHKPVRTEVNGHFSRYMSTKHPDSAVFGELLQTFIEKQRPSTLSTLPPIPSTTDTLPSCKRESTVYECIPDDQYLDMTPFNLVYSESGQLSDSEFEVNEEEEEAQSPPALPDRPGYYNGKSITNGISVNDRSAKTLNKSKRSTVSELSVEKKSLKPRPYSVGL